MSVDLTKYDEIQFHPDKKINKKIRAYMLIFDYQTSIDETSDEENVLQLKHWESVFLKDEFYEIIPTILNRRRELEEKMRYDKLSLIHKMVCKLSDVLTSIINDKTKNK